MSSWMRVIEWPGRFTVLTEGTRIASTSSASLSATGGICRAVRRRTAATTESPPWISMFSTSGISSSGCSLP
jgi:hypothetical protein